MFLRILKRSGLSAEKVYTFRRGQYAVDLELVVRNASSEDWPTRAYAQMRRLHNPDDRSFLNVDSYSFTGPVLYDGDEYEKLDFEDLQRDPVEQSVEQLLEAIRRIRAADCRPDARPKNDIV